MNNLKPIKLIKRSDNDELEPLNDEQLMRIGELAISRF
jgi:hypothetical protein